MEILSFIIALTAIKKKRNKMYELNQSKHILD